MATPPRLYITPDLSTKATIPLTREQAHYLSNVLRLTQGAQISLFNGRDGEWQASLDSMTKKGGVALAERQTRPQGTTPDVSLYFAPVKRGPMELIAQKATELGVAALAPVQTERTTNTRLNETRLNAAIMEAAEQCERLDLPELKPLHKLGSLLENWPPNRRLIFCDEAGSAPPMLEALAPFANKPPSPWAILVGPEGGFSSAERERLRALPFVLPVSLGPLILRAETAAFAALTLWQACLGDWPRFTKP